MNGGAIDNSNMLNYRDDSGTSGFVPKLTYTYNAGAAEIDIEEDSDYPVGRTLRRVQVKVHDKSGGTKSAVFGPAEDSGDDHEVTIDVSDLDRSKQLDITATIILDDDKTVADGGAYNIIAAGELGKWDIQKNA